MLEQLSLKTNINIQFLWTPNSETILRTKKKELFQNLSHFISEERDFGNIPKKFKQAIETVL